MTDNLIMLVATEAGLVVRPDDTLEDRLRAAMTAVKPHWMVTSEDSQFKGAVVAVYLASTDETERSRIEAELNGLRDLSAMLDGVPVDLDSIQPLEDPIGLLKIWKSIP